MRFMIKHTSFAIITVLLTSPVLNAVDVVSLRCEYRSNPLGIDATRPRLSWVMESKDRGGHQTAYQIIVEGAWDSGKVESDQSQNVEYNGKPLVSGMRYDWKVRVWDQAGKASEWSRLATWTMGILKPEDWTARWISTAQAAWAGAASTSRELTILKATYTARDGAGAVDVTEKVSRLIENGALNIEVAPTTLGGDPTPGRVKELVVEYELNGVRGSASAVDFERLVISSTPPVNAPYVRKGFDLIAVPTSALATVNVMGFYELYVNGEKVGPNVMGPALSDYNKRSLYETYDLTSYLRKGRNRIGLWISCGWRDAPIARMQLDMIVDGRPLRIVTDREWTFKSSSHAMLGPWKFNQMGGEQVDARLDDPRWSDPATTDSGWFPVAEVAAPAILAEAQKCPPMRVLKTIPAIACTKRADGRYQLDFGTQLTGWLKLRVRGQAAGDIITIEYADKLEPQQTYNQLDRFISAGKPTEEFSSKFNYHGFRWAIIKGLAAAPELADAEAELIGADFETRGGFACSSEQLNRMHQVNLWTIQCLSQSGFLSDCPHRERLGYGGDGQVSIESCIMNYWMQPFYCKWSTDWVDGANPTTGYMPHTAPNGPGGGGPAWGGLGQALTWRNYLYYQDTRIVERNLDACRRHIEAIEAHAKDGVVRAFGGQWGFIGDWVAPGRGMDTKNWPPKPAAELFNNCYRLYLREQCARMADVLGRQDEAKACRAELTRLRPLVHAAFYDKDKQLYVLDEQTYYLMPLMTGVVPEDLRPTILKKLEECIRVTRKGHLDTGMLGTYFLMNYLMDIGRNDLLWLIVTQKSYPGWGYMLEQGATAWWEQWNGYWSQIHGCFTSLDSWFYQGLAGIRPDLAKPGFKHIIVKPAVVGDLTWVTCHHDSPYGRVVSNWKREGQSLTMDITIPANTTATIYVPAHDAAGVTESDKAAAKAEGVKFLRMENDAAVYAVDSGVYRFQSTLPARADEGNDKDRPALLQLESDFEGGSGVLLNADQENRRLRFTPTPHPDRGWACWWYVKVSGIEPGETIALEIDVPSEAALGRGQWLGVSHEFARPDRAFFRFANGPWQHTAPGIREGYRIVYRQKVDAAEAWFAWGPPLLAGDAAKVVAAAAGRSPHATAFELCRSREDRPVPALRVAEPGAEDAQRYGIWVIARQHAWEVGSSWVACGLIQWLVSDDPRAQTLRQKALIHVVPVMDADNVARGAGGKGQWPHDHNRDWSEKPIFPEVAAVQRHILQLDASGRFDLFLDLHNPGPGDCKPFFHSPEKQSYAECGWANVERFVAAAVEEITGPMPFWELVRQTGQKHDAQMWQAMGEQWVHRHTADHAISLAMEIPWNTSTSTTDGYIEVGRQLGLTMERYFRSCPRR